MCLVSQAKDTMSPCHVIPLSSNPSHREYYMELNSLRGQTDGRPRQTEETDRERERNFHFHRTGRNASSGRSIVRNNLQPNQPTYRYQSLGRMKWTAKQFKSNFEPVRREDARCALPVSDEHESEDGPPSPSNGKLPRHEKMKVWR